MNLVATGLDRLAGGDSAALGAVGARRVGLLCHAASVDRELRHVRDVLQSAGVSIAALFGPEHGMGGAAQDMIPVGSEVRPATPVHSLYGDTENDLRPTDAMLDGLEVVVVDLQDVGSRYYTYVWTAALAMLASARNGLPTVVLDRPNPLGGIAVEGAPQRPGHRSFVGLYDVAVRHGLTIGEILRLVQTVEGIDAELLSVVPMLGYRRDLGFADTGLPWVMPSPNMPTLDTASVYPGGCLIEGTNLSEGRGTTRPFEIFGAPYVDGAVLAREITIAGAALRPLVFTPTFHKHARQDCGGVQVHVTDRQRFRPYEAYVRLVCGVARLWPESFGLRRDTYEFRDDKPAIDLLSGGPELRKALEAGEPTPAVVDELVAIERIGAERFRTEREPHLLYR